MPLNKNAYIRYHVIDACLRDRKRLSREEIMERIEQQSGFKISLSMFEKDIAAMRDMPEPFNYAPIKYNRGENYYYYDDPIYSLSKISLKEHEMEAVEMAAALLEQHINLPFMKQFTDTVKQIRAMLKTGNQFEGQNLMNHVRLKKTYKTLGQQYFKPLDDAIRSRTVVKFVYKPFFTENQTEYTLHPYLLNEFDNRWYVIGMCDDFNEIRTFGLDRIITLKLDETIKYNSGNFNPNEYFRHSLGFVTPAKGKPQKIRIKFNKLRGKYLISQPIHSSQLLIKESNNHYIFGFYLYHTYELETKILSWGDSVEVLAPIKLREAIADELRRSLKKYSK